MDTPEFDVVVVGSLNLDLVARARRLPGPGETVTGSSYDEFAGGKGLNQAVAAARSGARVAMVGAVGDDHAGADLRAVVRADGIDDGHIATADGVATGRAMITVDDAAENAIIVVPGANATVTGAGAPTGSVVLAQLEVPTEAVIRVFAAAREAGATTILNPAPAAELPDELLVRCDVVVPNEHELDLVGGIDRLFAAGVGHVVVTLGSRGVEVATRGEAPRRIAAFEVDPVDTTGAGDAFCGALASRLAVGEALADAATYAAAAGALATTVPGAVPSQPTAAAIRSLMRQRPESSGT